MNVQMRRAFPCCLLAVLVALSAHRALAQHGGAATPVGATQVREREIPASMKLVGTVMADREATVAAEVSGLVAAFPANEGDFLQAGDVICELEAEPAQLRLDEAAARLGNLRAQLDELENGTRVETVRRLRAAVEETQALYEKWEHERRRVQQLFESNQSNDKERHDTEMEFLAAQQRLTQAKASLEIAENGPRAEEIARARFDVAAQEAVVRNLERNLRKTKVRAPFAGFVVAKRTEVGEWIEDGGAVADMVAIETVKIRADVPERAITFARPGESATVEIDALGRRVSAKIARVIPRAVQAARTFPVEIDLPNQDHTILPGMFVWTYVPAGPPGKRLMVAIDAIVARGETKQVFVIRPGQDPTQQMAIPTPVTTGLEIEGEIEIHAPGVRAGDQVVTLANERLYGPTPVMIMPAGGPGAPAAEHGAPATPPSAGPADAPTAERPTGGDARPRDPATPKSDGAQETEGSTAPSRGPRA